MIPTHDDVRKQKAMITIGFIIDPNLHLFIHQPSHPLTPITLIVGLHESRSTTRPPIGHLLRQVDRLQLNLAAAAGESRLVVLVHPEQLRSIVVPVADCGYLKLAKNSGEI